MVQLAEGAPDDPESLTHRQVPGLAVPHCPAVSRSAPWYFVWLLGSLYETSRYGVISKSIVAMRSRLPPPSRVALISSQKAFCP